MRLFKSFFSKMGFDELRFKSAYNPHTEPSMEIFAPTMIKCDSDNIRELFGPKIDLLMVYKNLMCRLDKD
ncbi:hypothetical protein QR680_001287 [Steinernema hermaphroditum]|uniref:Phenylalanyl-tRNA synthetase domain-containing protein n=1 Tax=Steinernema hermaphroditum TaxID=289476 RepID=A0AA39H0F8_9BILA|nr:hypothetical protein QR680_001287 [Steinernema hermaphroditum]